LAVMFYTAPVSKNTVLWGEVGGKLKSISEKTESNQHSFRLDGLKPGRDYMYTVNDEAPVTFRTPPEAGQPMWFAAAGDAHVGNETSRPDLTDKIMAEIAKPTNGYSMFFDLGDTAQLGFNRKMWAQVGQEFAPFAKSIPTAFLPGNHDMMFGGDALYERYLGRIDGNGKADPLWQRVDVGDVHFLLLDLEWELQTYTPAEKAWLETQLKSIPKNDWTIVMCHTFFYGSGAPEDGWNWYDNKAVINEFAPLFEQYDVDLVMSGHKHQAEYLEKDGVAYVIAGTLGGRPDTLLNYKSPASKWLDQGAYGFTDVTISGGAATITFRDPDYKPLYTTKITR
jgi:acid phosphatase type 7